MSFRTGLSNWFESNSIYKFWITQFLQDVSDGARKALHSRSAKGERQSGAQDMRRGSCQNPNRNTVSRELRSQPENMVNLIMLGKKMKFFKFYLWKLQDFAAREFDLFLWVARGHEHPGRRAFHWRGGHARLPEHVQSAVLGQQEGARPVQRSSAQCQGLFGQATRTIVRLHSIDGNIFFHVCFNNRFNLFELYLTKKKRHFSDSWHTSRKRTCKVICSKPMWY